MSNFLDTIINGVKAVAPTVANLVLPGSGVLVHTLMRKVTGAGDEVPIEDVAAQIAGDPKLMLELRRMAIDREIRLAEIDRDNLLAVNETMREESKSEHWPQYAWRPFNGFAYPLAVILIYFILPYAGKAVPAVPQWIWVGWLSILGVATFGRNREKQTKAGGGAAPAGMLAGAIKAIRGGQ